MEGASPLLLLVLLLLLPLSSSSKQQRRRWDEDLLSLQLFPGSPQLRRPFLTREERGAAIRGVEEREQEQERAEDHGRPRGEGAVWRQRRRMVVVVTRGVLVEGPLTKRTATDPSSRP